MRGVINKLLWLTVGGGLLVLIDQLLKLTAWVDPLSLDNWRGLPEWLVQHKNYGISFGIELPYYLSVSLMALFLLLLLVLLFQHNTRSFTLITGLIASIAGGLSNLVDRINLGYVRDFISLSPWLPIFNLADVLVVVGVGFILVSIYLHGQPNNR